MPFNVPGAASTFLEAGLQRLTQKMKQIEQKFCKKETLINPAKYIFKSTISLNLNNADLGGLR